MTGKAALITGANRGIGRGCTLELARNGAHVAINYRSHADEAEEVASEVRAAGGKAITIQGDVGSVAVCRNLVEETIRAFGRIDVLVANAAATVRKPFTDLAEEEWRWVMDVTLGGVFHTAQTACRHMMEHKIDGSIIAIGSVHATLAIRNSLAYNTAKAALNHMVRSMANEMAAYRIRVNAVEPGWIDTPGETAFATKEQIREYGKSIPLGRIGEVEDIAKAVAFLASDDASYITGSVLRVDGGYVLPFPRHL